MKKIILLTTAALLAIPSIAQEKALKSYGFGDNWFIQGQGGASYTVSENSGEADFFKLVSPAAALSLGKHFSPQVGARVQVSGWESKSYLAKDKTYKINYLQANLDGLFNLGNILSKYQGEKSFNLYGILGIGLANTFKNDDYKLGKTRSVVPRVGLQADFALSKNLSLNVEAIGSLMADDFNGQVAGRKYDGVGSALVGLTYHFGKGFETVDVGDPAELQALNDKVNAQKAQLSDKDRQIQEARSAIAALERRLAEKPAPVKEVRTNTETEVLMNAVVVFRLGSAKLEQNQDINIYNAAKYLQENGNVNIIVTGYADKATGTPKINQKLSEQRSQTVADILIKKYGIAANRITVEASGDREQPFQIDAWNRVVIFTAK